MLIPFNEKNPNLHETIFNGPGVYVIGKVRIGKETTIWFKTFEVQMKIAITIGGRCSIQDNSTIYLYSGKYWA